MEYYPIPLRVNELMRGKRLEDETDIRLSIHQNIRMILKAFTMSYRFDPTFGCVMNKYHAKTPPQGKSDRAWKDKMRDTFQANLKEMLQRYETRVKVEDIRILMRQSKKKDKAVMNVRVEVIGKMTIGRRENFRYPDSEVSDDAKEVFPLMIPVGKSGR